MFQLGVLELCLGGLSLPKPPSGDGTKQTVDKIWRNCRSYYFFLQAFM